MNRAHVETVLWGVPLPASRRELVEYARRQGADGRRAAELLERIPERDYESIQAAGEELEPRQPKARRTPHGTKLPKEESDLTPGGGAYLGEPVEPLNVAAAAKS